MQEKFDELIEKYKKLSLNEKRNNLVKDFKEMIAVYLYLAESNNIPVELLNTKEILDINDKNYTEDDYLEAIYSYFNVLKEIVLRLLENKYFQ